MPQSLHILSAHIIFSTKGRHPWLTANIRKLWKSLKKDSSKFVKTLDPSLRDFRWQDGYGLFSVSPAHFYAVRKYILD
jgi:hypothetical protein